MQLAAIRSILVAIAFFEFASAIPQPSLPHFTRAHSVAQRDGITTLDSAGFNVTCIDDCLTQTVSTFQQQCSSSTSVNEGCVCSNNDIATSLFGCMQPLCNNQTLVALALVVLQAVCEAEAGDDQFSAEPVFSSINHSLPPTALAAVAAESSSLAAALPTTTASNSKKSSASTLKGSTMAFFMTAGAAVLLGGSLLL